MKAFYTILILLFPFFGYSQEKFTIVSEKLGEFYFVNQNPKSKSNFYFQIPIGYQSLGKAKDSTLIETWVKEEINTKSLFELSGKIPNVNQSFFTLGVRELNNESKEKFLNMSNLEFKEFIQKTLKRDKENEISILYEEKKLFWIITIAWSKEKNGYVIAANLNTKHQFISLIFMSNIKGEIEKDVLNIKKLINSFNFFERYNFDEIEIISEIQEDSTELFYQLIKVSQKSTKKILLNGVIYALDENNKLDYEKTYLDGKNIYNKFSIFNKIFEGGYLNNKREGLHKIFHTNGNLEFEGKYVNGKKEGIFRSYNSEGILVKEENYENNNKIGSYKKFYDNGNIMLEGNISNGMRVGIFKFYNKNGSLESIKDYEDGEYNWSEEVKELMNETN